MTTRASRTLAIGAIVGALALSGCSGAEQGASDTGTPTTTSSATTSAATGDASDNGAAAAGIDAANPPKPIASATSPAVVEGDPKATMKVDLLGLKRQGKTLVATYAFTVTSPAGVDKAEWLYDYLGGHGWDPSLVDSKNLKLHNVVKAGGQLVASDYQGSEFSSGQTFYAYAVFGAPPEDVTTMDVIASHGLPAFIAVPIS